MGAEGWGDIHTVLTQCLEPLSAAFNGDEG